MGHFLYTNLLLRASGTIVNESEFYVIGSQSILGQYPNAPEKLLVSNEADIICKIDPGKGDRIEGAIIIPILI